MDEVIEQPVDSTPADSPIDNSPADATPLDGLEAPQSDATPAQPNFEDLFKDPEPDTPAPVDPNAPAATVPPEFERALGISEFVKDPTQLAGAVTLADQVIKVQNGQAPVEGLLNNFWQQNPAGFEKMFRDELIPFIEKNSGWKLVDPATLGSAQQKTPDQQRIEAIEAQFATQRQEAQQAQQQQAVNRANGVLTAKTDEALKGTFLEGKGKDILSQLIPHLGMSEAQAIQALNNGNTAMVDKAVKAVMAQKEAEGRAYAKWKINESKTLKAGLPAGKGNPRVAAPGELPEGATMADKIAYLNAAS